MREIREIFWKEKNMCEIKQIFNPPLCLCNANENNKETIEKRIWNTQTQEILNDNTQNMGYIGKMQIEEVWKHAGYFVTDNSKKIWSRVTDLGKPDNKIAHVYVSNYGYIAIFSKEEGKEIFSNKDGTSIYEIIKKGKKEKLKKRNIVPENRVNSSCEICLNVLAESNNSNWDIHRLVATNFLKPEGKGYVVHHIDNNSYNNNVTNLIYLKAETHRGEQHKIYHPMSRK